MRRRWRPAGILLGLTVCAALAYGKSRAGKQDEILYRFEEQETVETVSLENNNGKLQFYKGGDGSWMVKATKEYRAEEKKLNLLTSALEAFEVTRILDEEKAEYGFSDANASVSFTTNFGNEHSFLVGNLTMTKNHVYIKDLDTGQVLITGMGTVVQMDGGLASFRSREVFTVDVESIVGISLSRQGQEELSLQLTGTEWELVSPYRAPARKIELSEFLAAMKDWNVYGFADSSVLTEEKMRLLEDGTVLTLVDADGRQQTLGIGASDGTVIPIRNGGEDDILLLYADEVDLDILDADKLLFFAPLKAGVDAVAEIEMEFGEASVVLQVDGEKNLFCCNGRPVAADAFYSFYLSYIGMTAAGKDLDTLSAKAETLATLRTVFRDGSVTEVKLIRRDDSTCHMMVNNTLSGFYLGNEKLVSLMSKLKSLSDY